MSQRTHVHLDTDHRGALTQAGDWSRPRVTCYVGKTGQGNDPFYTDGYNTIGRAISIPDFAKDLETEDVNSGGVKGHDYTLITGSKRNLAFTFDKLKLVAKWLSMGTDVDIDPQYATDGQTTISSATRTSGTVASATGLSKGNLIIVDTRHATYSGFLEAVVLKSVSGTTVTWDPPLDHTPADSTDFLKVAGTADKTAQADLGIIIPDVLDIVLPRVAFVVEEFYPGTRMKYVRWWPEVEVVPGAQNPSGNMKTVSFSVKPIQQAEESFSLVDGTTESRPWYGKAQWVPA